MPKKLRRNRRTKSSLPDRGGRTFSAVLSRSAGERGRTPTPMDHPRRLAAYHRQNSSERLTPAQARREQKKANRAGISLDAVTRDLASAP